MKELHLSSKETELIFSEVNISRSCRFAITFMFQVSLVLESYPVSILSKSPTSPGELDR